MNDWGFIDADMMFSRVEKTASSHGQAVALSRCLAADRASPERLADDRPCQTQPSNSLDHSNPDISSSKTKRSLESLRRKRLRRNKKKRETLKQLPKGERRARLVRTQTNDYTRKKRIENEVLLKKEKRLSAFLWSRWQEERRKQQTNRR